MSVFFTHTWTRAHKDLQQRRSYFHHQSWRWTHSRLAVLKRAARSQQINQQAEGVIVTAGAVSLRSRAVSVPIVTENPRDVKYYSNCGHILSTKRWKTERQNIWCMALELITCKSEGSACKRTMPNCNQGVSCCPWLYVADLIPSRCPSPFL